ncbi:hypothetical protein M9H77_03823 [Catharanthus roseus]|uniref:Uncharacterized protein n=1 Tax=Catharanthus roseus TaxID=4058 RepID=A0ACC0CCE5_CATRO|nr:hypothetical protein M9H77_03823 [Catharanthus roseus]
MAQIEGQYGVIDIFFDHSAAKNVRQRIINKGKKRKDKNLMDTELNGGNFDDAEIDLSEFCDSEFEVENEDGDGIWRNVYVNSLSRLDGKDVMGAEIGKSKIDNAIRVEEKDCIEIHVENDGVVQEGSESDEDYKPTNEDFQLFEGEKI